MAVLYDRRAGRLTAKNGGFRPPGSHPDPARPVRPALEGGPAADAARPRAGEADRRDIAQGDNVIPHGYCSLIVIGCHCLGICRLFLLSYLLSFSVKMTVLPWATGEKLAAWGKGEQLFQSNPKVAMDRRVIFLQAALFRY